MPESKPQPPQTAPPTAPPAADDKPPRHELGILLVHGIGRQQPGETLIRFGEPIVKWIQGWFEGVGAVRAAHEKFRNESKQTTGASPPPPPQVRRTGTLSVDRSRVIPEGVAPAHAALTLELSGPGDERQRSRWLMAESFWGSKFQPPTFFELAFWGFVVFPWTNAVHFGAVIRRRWERVWPAKGLRRFLLVIWMLFVSTLLLAESVLFSIIVLLALGLLLILALPPIPSLRSALLKVQRALTRSLGDSFILIDSPLQRSAIVTQVRRDLAWLSRRCARVVVIAHSQGAAISFEALRGHSRRVDTFVTFGSGISKIELISRALRTEVWWYGVAAFAAPIAAIVIIDLCGWVDLIPWLPPDPDVDGWGLVIVGLLWAAAAGESFSASKFDPEDFNPEKCFGTPVKWRDYYASEDPVPNGPLMDVDPPSMVSQQVYNRHALWSDHTTYWSNREEFIPLVVSDLAQAAGLPLMTMIEWDPKRLVRAAQERRCRVLLFARCRVAAWLVFAALVVVERDRLVELGEHLLGRLGWADAVLSWVGLGGISPGSLVTNTSVCVISGALVVGASVAAVYGLLWLAWLWWGAATTRSLLRRKAADDAARWLFGWFAILVAQLLILAWLRRLAWQGSFESFAWKMAGATVLAIFVAAIFSRAISRKKTSPNSLALAAFTGIVIAWPLAGWMGDTLMGGEYRGPVTIAATGVAAAILAMPIRWIVGDSGPPTAP